MSEKAERENHENETAPATPEKGSKDVLPQTKYSKRELSTLEGKFRKKMKSRIDDMRDHTKQVKRTRNLILLISFWLAVLTMAVIYGWSGGEKPIETTSPVLPGPSAPAFLEQAVLPAGLKEVGDARLAALDGLAPGSQEARELQKAYSIMTKLPVETENSIGMRFRLVPPGSFIMGSPPQEIGRSTDEQAHEVNISTPYYIGKFETTQMQWSAVMGSNPSYFKNQGEQRPVEEVSWNDCQAFLRELEVKEGLAQGSYRLATEEEWEYACRAGTQTPFCFGDSRQLLNVFADTVWTRGDHGTHVVGMRRGNAWGIHDMHGNVWEWCQDGFYNYRNPGEKDPLRKSLRGGHWRADYPDCRSASRFLYPKDTVSNLLGFRVVRIIDLATETSAQPESHQEQ